MNIPRKPSTTTTALAIIVLSTSLLSILHPQNQQTLLAQITQTKQTMTPKAALERLFTTDKIEADWFDSTFLASVPLPQIQQIIDNLKKELGNYQQVQPEEKDYLIIFDRASVPTKIALNQKGQIIGILFQAPRSQALNLSEALAQFKALPGKVNFLVMEGKQEKAALNADMPLAVGSAFKLAVLSALKSQITSGQKSWQDIVELQPNWKSLPSGFLQTWPDGSLLTIQTLAALMISQSDNTATDTLINLVGLKDIEAITPRNRPFFTTKQLFILKTPKNSELLKRYQAAKEAERRAILQEVDKQPLPDVSEFQSTPTALDIEWFFTPQELCNLMEKVADLPLMSINPGVVDSKDWEKVAFKGGSEPGVLNLTTWLKAKNGKTYCVVATWNNDNETLEESRFMSLYNGVINGLN